jgi:hypothetical protein
MIKVCAPGFDNVPITGRQRAVEASRQSRRAGTTKRVGYGSLVRRHGRSFPRLGRSFLDILWRWLQAAGSPQRFCDFQPECWPVLRCGIVCAKSGAKRGSPWEVRCEIDISGRSCGRCRVRVVWPSSELSFSADELARRLGYNRGPKWIRPRACERPGGSVQAVGQDRSGWHSTLRSGMMRG